MAHVPTLLALLLTATCYVNAQTACSVRHDAACVAALRSLYTNTSAYWFGTGFTTVCPPDRGGVQCTNPRPSRTSLLTRIFGNDTTDPSGLAFVVNVTYTITLPADGSDRTYPGCGRIVEVPLTGPQTFSIDPLANSLYTPFDLRDQPEVTWPAEENALYTVMYYAAGSSYMHGLYVNVAGGRLEGGDTIASHLEPEIPAYRITAFVWIVFKQQTSLNASNVDSIFKTLTSRDRYRIYPEDIVSALGLSTQSYGINVIKIVADEYTTIVFRDFDIFI
ncbi:uncharacterized protein LOC124113913 [Haliotis rufescens]|uniref:uncharacterized protein LOC124113913 n=1 Tax=Haliotis rufescens TaxID=6454 RepID=UPI00201EFAAF|nr:uncharacterized protein LOC124113913 [Haliotis rufescens]